MPNACSPGLLPVSLLSLALAGIASAAPVLVVPRFAPERLVVAEVVLEPPEAGSASGVIQAALDRVGDLGAGTVFLRSGRYLVDEPLAIPPGVILQGEWASPERTDWESGTLLAVTCGHGDEDAPPAIGLQRNTAVRDLTVWYPRQDAAAPVPYPWSIDSTVVEYPRAVALNCNQTVWNVTLVNPYRGIRIGPEKNFHHVLRNIHGTPLACGIWIDACYDIGRTYDIHFSPRVWAEADLPNAPGTAVARRALENRLLESAVGLDLGRDEWGYLWNVAVEGYSRGVLIRAGDGAMNGVLYGFRVTGCRVALELSRVSRIGLSVFEGSEAAVLAPERHEGCTQFNSCTFVSPVGARLASGTVTFQNCTFSGQGFTLDASCSRLALVSSRFEGDTPARILLHGGLRSAAVVGSAFSVPPVIDRTGADDHADVQVCHGAKVDGRPSLGPFIPAPERGPARRELFVVTAFGASSDADDNTAAFQAALDAAGVAGGGVVYVPAGLFRFAGSLRVPTGVELRGALDAPHHTTTAGAMLLVLGGRGEPEAPPFIELESGSGVRGLSIWYPEQDNGAITAYPWTIRGLGPGCWVRFTNIGNAFRGVDFWTHPSTGHVVQHLSGCYFDRAVAVSKCSGRGWVEGFQANPHHSMWPDDLLPTPDPGLWPGTIDYLRTHLQGIVVGDCGDEQLLGNFLYAAHRGLVLREDGGRGPSARVLMHGTDTGPCPISVEAAGEGGLEFVNSQLVPYGDGVEGAIVVRESFAGQARFINTTCWPANTSFRVSGSGDVLVQQLNSLCDTGGVDGGRFTLQTANLPVSSVPQLRAGGGAERVRVVACSGQDAGFRSVAPGSVRVERLANALPRSVAPLAGETVFSLDWEQAEPGAEMPEWRPGGMDAVDEASARVEDGIGYEATRGLRVSGRAGSGHAYAYFGVAETPVAVYPDTVLSYWFRPLNPSGRTAGVDLAFVDGGTLRAGQSMYRSGEAGHPAVPKGTTGEWTRMEIELGRYFSGRVVAGIGVAWDRNGPAETFDLVFDDLRIESRYEPPTAAYGLEPGPGVYPVPLAVRVTAPIDAPAGLLRYVTDGSVPGLDSPHYDGSPVVLTQPGVWDVRFALLSQDGRLRWCAGGPYEILPVPGGEDHGGEP
jgi:hypothetical protein